MKTEIKIGGIIGSLFAAIAYTITLYTGFNPSSLSLILYLFVILGIVMKIDISQITESKLLERIVIVAEEEELRLKKVFTGEEYRVNGDVEKL